MDSSSRVRGAIAPQYELHDLGRSIRGDGAGTIIDGPAPEPAPLRFPSGGGAADRRRSASSRSIVALRTHIGRQRRRARQRAMRITRAAGLTTRASWSAVLWGWVSTRSEIGGGDPDAHVMELGTDELARACAVMLQETWYEWLTDRRASRGDGVDRRRTRVA
ncbi:MAG: hypothetical protein AMS20_13845 [Gemmatimonas sp. SG8_28]|nr:MAG: hypothetical protein AMS20_13845 [Gemmatimonas sp. SG8_28]